MSDQSSSERTMFYTVALKIHHPTEDPATISNELGLRPQHGWTAGQPRTTPTGAPLPGFNRETYWAVVKQIEHHRRFFDTVVEFIVYLEAAADYVTALLASGGRACVSVSLPGHVNIGDRFEAAPLARLARLGVALEIEVFPDMP